MQTWKHPSDYGGFSPEGDYVLITRNRDSSSLDRSNWECICQDLKAEAYDGGREYFEERPAVYHWRAGHWAVGWVEYLCIRADAPAETIDQGNEIEEKLDNYPAYDESHWSDLEYNEVYEYWDRMSLRERIQMCADKGYSIFAARGRDGIPDGVYESLRD